MEVRQIWRNGTTEKLSKFKICFSYIWLIPGVPLAIYFFAFYLDARNRNTNDYEILGFLFKQPHEMNIIFGLIGVLFWLTTIRALSRPLFQINENEVLLYKIGFWATRLGPNSVKTIKVYNLGPIGLLMDIKSSAGTNLRFFALLAKYKKDNLQSFFERSGVKIV